MTLLALVVVTLALSLQVTTEVVKSFQRSCPQFFAKSPNLKMVITPTVLEGNQYKQICQLYKNSYTYATLFDTRRRIPVYSAYTFKGKNVIGRENVPWKNEPQLDNLPGKEMKEFDNSTWEQLMNQAVKKDYAGSGYTRGHVFPSQFAINRILANSTFTFTNVAPQTKFSNNNWSEYAEQPLLNQTLNKCKADRKHEIFIVTGVVPGNNWISINRNNSGITNGINIPTHFWTAYCCISFDDKRISGAFIAEQNETGNRVDQITVRTLNQYLTKYYNQSFKVFSKLCLD